MPHTLIRGDQLPARLQAQVLRMYVHRWTWENARQSYGGRCPGCEQSRTGVHVITGPKEAPVVRTVDEWHAYHVPLVSDAEWLAAHAFRVTRAGELDARQRHAEPGCLAEV